MKRRPTTLVNAVARGRLGTCSWCSSLVGIWHGQFRSSSHRNRSASHPSGAQPGTPVAIAKPLKHGGKQPLCSRYLPTCSSLNYPKHGDIIPIFPSSYP